MKHWIGRWLMGTAFIHIAIATVQYAEVLLTVAEHGVFNTVAGDPVVGAVVWSLLFGAVAFIGGMAVAAIEKAGAQLPKSLGWSLLALAIVGAVLIPASGFWLLLPPALVILTKRRSSPPGAKGTDPLGPREART